MQKRVFKNCYIIYTSYIIVFNVDYAVDYSKFLKEYNQIKFSTPAYIYYTFYISVFDVVIVVV
jgi:hypothetical protein